MNISIESIIAIYPDRTLSIRELAENAEVSVIDAEASGISRLHAASVGTLTTDLAADAVKIALSKAKIDSMSVDQLAFISECIGDYLYMDASKTVIKKMGGRDDNLIYSSDFFRGNSGTLGIIEIVGNQLTANPNIRCSVISTSLVWESHSNKRRLGDTFLGDGAGAIVMSDHLSEKNRILSISVKSLSRYSLVSGFKYGGTLYDFTADVVHNNKFVYSILDQECYKGVMENVISVAVEVGKEALEKAGCTVEDISYIGISGFNKTVNKDIVSKFGVKEIIDPLNDKGFLGSLGAIEVLSQFINDDNIKYGKKMLLFTVGIDVNVEALVIQK